MTIILIYCAIFTVKPGYCYFPKDGIYVPFGVPTQVSGTCGIIICYANLVHEVKL